MTLFYERETRRTMRGNRVAVLRDAPNSFHVTVQGKDLAVYENFSEVTSNEHLMQLALKLEQELYPPTLPEKTDDVVSET